MGTHESVVRMCPPHLNLLAYHFLSRFMPTGLQSPARDQIHSLNCPDRRFHAV